MKILIALLTGFCMNLHAQVALKEVPADVIEAHHKIIRNHMLGILYSDCYGREATDEELEAGQALTPAEIIKQLHSDECRTEEAQARRKERAEEKLAEIKARQEALPESERRKITKPEGAPEGLPLRPVEITAASATR